MSHLSNLFPRFLFDAHKKSEKGRKALSRSAKEGTGGGTLEVHMRSERSARRTGEFLEIRSYTFMSKNTFVSSIH